MRKHSAWAGAILALVLTACGSSPSGSTSASSAGGCVNSGAAHHAFVVVEHLSGASFQKCVGFAGDGIDGQTLMDQSKVEYQTQTFSFGKGVCQVDNEPKQYTECFPKNQPYWSLFVETKGAWAMSQTGYNAVTLHDKDALGWRYVPATDQHPSPPPPAKEG